MSKIVTLHQITNSVKEARDTLLKTYDNLLIWIYDMHVTNCIYMYEYGENITNNKNILIFYEKNNKHYIDIGYSYKYGDYDYGRFDLFGWFTKITTTISLENNIYDELLNKIYEKTGGYLYIDISDAYKEDVSYEGDITIMYDEKYYLCSTDNDINFKNDDEKNKYVKACVKKTVNRRDDKIN